MSLPRVFGLLSVLCGIALSASLSFAQAPPTVFTYQLCLRSTTRAWNLNFVAHGSSILVTGDKTSDPDDNWGTLSGSMTINKSGEINIGLTAVGWNNAGTALGYAGETVNFRAFSPPYTSFNFREARFGSTEPTSPNKVVTGTATVVPCAAP